MTHQFIITKRIAKHGGNSTLIIPCDIKAHLKPGTLVQATIQIVEE
jgi:hypothetical protein